MTVTVPNAYNEEHKQDVKKIFNAAGLLYSKITILNESLAGMLGYIHLNMDFLRNRIKTTGGPLIVCNIDCGSQTNDTSLFQISLSSNTLKIKVLAYE